MCGICGIVDNQGPGVNPALLDELNSRLFHRGPDEGGRWTNGSIGLAMRRLAVIDLTTGQQPIFNEDGTIAVVFNGEIYNYEDLHSDLLAAGHRFKTRSDTETIIHAYEQYGIEALGKLNGMFAIALWDANKKQLLLARDRVGKKPLYYSVIGTRLAFSSELPSLLQHPGISRDIDRVALDDYFSLGYVPPPHTIFTSVRQLDPGHFLLWKDGELEKHRYWRLAAQQFSFSSEDEACEQLLDLLRDAVKIRLHSDVPFGALLSGGVDSGLVVGLMSQLMNRPVKTFTMGFEDEKLDESEQAAAIARHFGAEHHHLIARSHNAIDLATRIVKHCGEPFADSSAIPTFLISELARQHVTVALSGDGGDEVFGGYNAYRYHAKAALYRRIPRSIRAVVKSAALQANERGGSLARRARRFTEEAELPVEMAWRHSRSLFSDSELTSLYSREFSAGIDLTQRGRRIHDAFHYFRASGDGDAAVLNHVDYETYLPGDILVKVDRMSMANSLELRAPLLDYRIAEFAAALPSHWKWTPSESKRLLKKAARAVLPASALNRPKQGFVAPLASWLRGELQPFMREVIAGSAAGCWINLNHCRELLDRHARHEGVVLERQLWSILSFLLWHREFAQ